MTDADGVAATTAVGRRPPGPRPSTPPPARSPPPAGAGYLVAGEWLVRRLFATYGPIVSDSATGASPWSSSRIPNSSSRCSPRSPTSCSAARVCVRPRSSTASRLDVRSRSARASATSKAVDTTASWQGPRERPADHPGQHASSPCRLAPTRAVQGRCTQPANSPWTSSSASCSVSRTAASAHRLGRPFETLLDLGSSERLISRVAVHSVGGLKTVAQARTGRTKASTSC